MCLLCLAAAAGAEPVAARALAAASSKVASGSSPGFIVASFVHPVLFSFLGTTFYSYGAFGALGCVVSFNVITKEFRRARIHLTEFMYLTLFFIGVIGGIIGAKTHLILSSFAGGSLDNARDMFHAAIDLNAGFSFMGGFIGSVFSLVICLRCFRVRPMLSLDVVLPGILVVHAIGKIGCFMSGDGCYGPVADPSRVPWAMSFPYGEVPTMLPVHPTPIYEGICSFSVLALVRAIFPYPAEPVGDAAWKEEDTNALEFPQDGRRTALLLVLYGIERIVIEEFRRHPALPIFGGLTEYQALAVLLMVIGLLIEVIRYFYFVDPGQTQAQMAHEKKHM